MKQNKQQNQQITTTMNMTMKVSVQTKVNMNMTIWTWTWTIMNMLIMRVVYFRTLGEVRVFRKIELGLSYIRTPSIDVSDWVGPSKSRMLICSKSFPSSVSHGHTLVKYPERLIFVKVCRKQPCYWCLSLILSRPSHSVFFVWWHFAARTVVFCLCHKIPA